MNVSLLQVFIFMLAGIAVIILLTVKYSVHAFFALLIACFVTGIGVQIPVPDLINTIKDGFGNIMKSLALIIVLGTTLGVILEHTGSTNVMANYILKKTGEKHAALAISITGFIVGLPVFCDSGFIVLSGLNKSLARSTGISVVIMSVSLAAGLYSVHCLIPPHPGAAAAAVTIGVDFGKLIFYGIIIALPAAFAGYLWANHAGKKIRNISLADDNDIIENATDHPSVLAAFLPVIVPVALIAVKAFYAEGINNENLWLRGLLAMGDPVIALSIGVLLAFNTKRRWNKNTLNLLLQSAIEKAGSILVIIGAGGAFGAVLAATKIGSHLAEMTVLNSLGLLFPFLFTFILKTAQGSSTVAIITAASVVQPLLHTLGLDTETGKLICVLSMGAGSMMISHANDAYFWVIAKFSGLDMQTTLKVYSVASVFMGLTALMAVYILSLISS
ncbi:MAG TPA: GntP family permease [Panacibacter sp.]|nr:GntP family permease [Panacibacter sp.]